MNPFDRYPHEGRVLLGRRSGENARRGYGLRLQQITGQHDCTYCGVDLIGDYYRWLLLSVDHVIPVGEAKRLGIPLDFSEDLINLVLSCSACNGFDNRYKVPRNPQPSWTLDGFVELRDDVFAERRPRIAALHARDLVFFERQSWSH
jgi:HNH endonuclease